MSTEHLSAEARELAAKKAAKHISMKGYKTENVRFHQFKAGINAIDAAIASTDDFRNVLNIPEGAVVPDEVLLSMVIAVLMERKEM